MRTSLRCLRVIVVAALAFSLAACTRGAQTPSDPQVLIEKHVGDEFKLVFEANASTGYHWEVMDGLDTKIVELVNKYYQSSSEVTLAGGPGVEIWVFRATGVGETTITLGYYPPGNAGTGPEQTETFTVKVLRED